MSQWLPLAEYSNKYRVSISTLRRRIKHGQVECSYDQGKYLLKDAPLKNHKPQVQPQVTSAPPPSTAQVGHLDVPEKAPEKLVTNLEAFDPLEKNSPVWATANNLLGELKKAYMLILQEKEEQILQLREEATDLKMLVKILEDENNRLKSNLSEAAPIDTWLNSLSDQDLEIDT